MELELFLAPTVSSIIAQWNYQSTLRPTRWVTLECTKNNSTGPHKPMNFFRNSLLAKITLGYLKWLRAYGRNNYAHQHPNSHVFANYSCTLNIQGVFLYRVIISNDENYSVG